MHGLDQSGAYTLRKSWLGRLRRDFDAGSASEAETLETIRSVHRATGMVIDPHTAVGVSVARRHGRGAAPMVVLATAHAAKFPKTVRSAIGVEPRLPDALGDLFERRERMTPLANDVDTVKAAIADRVAAGAGACR
jgi:threonine synthase